MIDTTMPFVALFFFTSINGAPLFLQQRSGAVVAIVSGIEIVRSDIAVSSDEVEFRYKLKRVIPSRRDRKAR